MERRTDRDLLADYVACRSEAAFSELVRRHAGKVHAAALRLLGDSHAAEDASQAVFLVLAERAGRLTGREAISGWLLKTTSFVAARALRERARRARREEVAVKGRTIPALVADRETWRDMAPHVDSALARLGAHYRDAVVLRYMDGIGQAEAARELGVSEGALAMRASRGLEKLRKLLGGRSAKLSATSLGAVLRQHGSSAAPAGLAALIQKACLDKAAAAGTAATLAKGAMEMMFWAKVRLATVVVSAAAVVGAGGGTVIRQLTARGGEPAQAAMPVAPDKPEPPTVVANKILPSLTPDKELLAKIEALGENESLLLPKPRIVGEFNEEAKKRKLDKSGPGHRNFCAKTVWEPDRKRALYCGGAYMKPINDIWEYDLPSNTWVLLYPPRPPPRGPQGQGGSVSRQGRRAPDCPRRSSACLAHLVGNHLRS